MYGILCNICNRVQYADRSIAIGTRNARAGFVSVSKVSLFWLRFGRGRCTPSQPIAAGAVPPSPCPARRHARHTRQAHGSIHGSNRLATADSHTHTIIRAGGWVIRNQLTVRQERPAPRSPRRRAQARTPPRIARSRAAIVSPIASRIRRMQKAGACITLAPLAASLTHAVHPSARARSARALGPLA